MNSCYRAIKPEWWRRRIRELNVKAFKSNMSEEEYLRKRQKIFEVYERR